MDDIHNPNYPGMTAEQYEAERRAELHRKYVRKFEGIFLDIECAIAALELLAEYDTAAKECANTLSDALSEMRFTVESSA